jgi:hypothetical protein
MKHGSASGASVATSETSRFFLRCASRGTLRGGAKKNEPKMLDALDAGSDGAARSAAGFHNFGFTDFPIADTQISEPGGCCRPEADPC